MGFDIYYIILVIPAMIFSFWASMRVNSAFKKYSNVYSRSNMTGRQAAEAVLRQNGVAGVTVVPISGNLTDHYDPAANQIRLSEKVYSSTSCAAIGVAGDSLAVGAVLGIVGAVIGTYGGAALRAKLAAAFGSDRPAALIEDAVAIGGAVAIVCALAPA